MNSMKYSALVNGNLKSNKKIITKKLTKKILRKIMRVKLFKETSLNYVNYLLINDQKLEITKKFFKLVHRWVLDTDAVIFVNFRKRCDDIENNPRFKLPWTILEAEQSGKIFCSWFNQQKDDLLQ